jgi:formylglycine-generating enzyme required for sulfatase activity
MHGNVWEWCQNEYNRAVKVDQEKVETIDDNDHRVLRGGSFNDDRAFFVRCAFRDKYSPPHRNYDNGFRLARTLR